MKRFLSVSALMGAVLLGSTGQAYAYLDPGVGSMLLQGLIAGIAAVSVAVGYYWDRLKSFFRSAPSRKSPSATTEARDGTRR